MKRVSVRNATGWRRARPVSEPGGTGWVRYVLGGPHEPVRMTAVDRDGWAKVRDDVKEEA